MAETDLYWPSPTAVTDPQLPSRIGKKASGLLQIPEAWRPPFFVLPTAMFSEWKTTGAGGRDLILADASSTIFENAKRFDLRWNAGLILRSSAAHESLADRGSYESEPITADYGIDAIRKAIDKVFSQFARTAEDDHLALIVQPLVPGPKRFLGHISNERRVSKTVNQWMLESSSANWVERFNSQRATTPDLRKELVPKRAKDLTALFRSVGRWCTQFNKGPAHIEWAWSNGSLWLLQLDFEDESPDDGVDPQALLRAVDTSLINIADIRPLHIVDLSGPRTGWPKIDKVKELAGIREPAYPKLYYVTGKTFTSFVSEPEKLIASIRDISNGRAVCRTDCISKKVENLNLPRTHSVSPEKAVEFMKDTVSRLVSRGAKVSEICFILHRFIPAAASAWALADPKSQIVRVDSLWGIPDGLQFLPHDTFEFDAKRREISSSTIRYKVSFIQETNDGSWKEIKIARRYGRSTSLAASDVREVASQTHQLAIELKEKIQVMWFCTVPKELGIGRNLPWFRMPAPELRISAPRTVGPMRPRFFIRNKRDLNEAKSLDKEHYVLAVQPNIELIRSDNDFLDRLVEVALKIQAPVELHGSVLAHAYYELNRAGVTVIAAGEPLFTRTRGRQVFAKLVRDEIPQQIMQHGEIPVLAHIQKQEARPALIAKLFEEAHELLNAVRPDEVEAELADLLEVIRSLASATGISWEDVESKADAKRSKRGASIRASS